MTTMTAATVAPRKSAKLFYRIQEVSRMTGLKPYVLRYWETEFPELSPAKDQSDQRRYRQGDIDVVLAIRKLLYEERYTIEGARRRLKNELRQRREEQGRAGVREPARRAASPRQPSNGAGAVSARRLNQSLGRLRKEVKALLAMLKD